MFVLRNAAANTSQTFVLAGQVLARTNFVLASIANTGTDDCISALY